MSGAEIRVLPPVAGAPLLPPSRPDNSPQGSLSSPGISGALRNSPRRPWAPGAFWSIPNAKTILAAAVAALTLTATAQAEEYKPEIPPLMRLLPGAAGCPTQVDLVALLKDISDASIPAPAGCKQVRASPILVIAEYVGHFDVGDWRWYVIRATDQKGFSMLVPVERRNLSDVLGTAL